jgi:hypothetical protein
VDDSILLYSYLAFDPSSKGWKYATSNRKC